ncbi:MAG TPA: hypothetical protein VN786_00860, partial [Acidimicrobiales bacterium]|nr:hypothetical protein [Acidimicrobiales bacterium]
MTVRTEREGRDRRLHGGPGIGAQRSKQTDELESPARWLALDRSLVVLDGSRPGGDDRLAPGLDAAAGPRAVRR